MSRHNNGVVSAETLASDSKERFRLVADYAYDWEYWLSPEGNYLYVSPSCERVTGYRPDEFRQDPHLFVRITHPDDRPIVERHLQEEQIGPQPRTMDFRILTRDGQERWLNHVCQRVYDAGGRWLGWRGSNRDISERKQVEQEREQLLAQVEQDRQIIGELAAILERERDLLQVIMDNTHACLAYLDPQFNFVRVNSAYARLSGHTQEELLGRNHFYWFPSEENQAIFERVRDTGRPVEFRARAFKYADQPERGVTYWDWTLVPAKDVDGRVQGFVFSLLEVTQQVQAAQELEQHLDRLGTLFRASKQVLAERTLEGLLQQIVDAARELTGARAVACGHGYRDGTFQVGAASRAEDAPPCPPGEVFTIERGGVHLDLLDKTASLHLTDREMRDHPAWWGLPDGHTPLRGLLGARLVGRDGQAEGLILVSDREQGDFTPEDESLLGQLATLASLGLQHIEARSDAERRAGELATVFAAMTEAVTVYDASGRLMRANPAALTTFGFDPTTTDGQAALQKLALRRSDGRPVAPSDLPSARALRGETVGGERYAFSDAAGETRVVQVSATPLLASGQVSGAVVVWHDVTEEVKIEHTLRESEEKLEALFEILPVGLSILDEHRQIRRSNPALSRLLGLTQDELMDGSYVQRRYIRSDGTEVAGEELPSVQASREQRAVENVEIGVVKEDDEVIWTSVSAVPFSYPDWSTVVATIDITDRKRAEDALRRARDELQLRVEERTAELVEINRAMQVEVVERRRVERDLRVSEERFRQLAENIREVFWLMDPETGRFLYISPAYDEVWGRPREGLYEEANVLLEYVHPEDQEALVAAVEPGGEGYDVEFRVVRPDAEQRWIRARAFPIHDERGKIYRVAGIAEDITLRKQAQDALVQAERLAMAGQLAASLAHEINNPLQSVVGCLDLSLEALDTGDDPRPLLQVAAEASERAARVVAQLRTLHRRSRLEAKKLVNLNTLVEKVLILTRKQSGAHSVEVIWQAEPDLPDLQLMPDGMQQVFLNLVINAIAAMPRGGRLRVATRRTAKPPGIDVEFADTGMGISPEIEEHLFEPFQTTKPDGLGLGLFISQNIVQQHGGSITAHSRPGKGATFTVWLPL